MKKIRGMKVLATFKPGTRIKYVEELGKWLIVHPDEPIQFLSRQEIIDAHS